MREQLTVLCYNIRAGLHSGEHLGKDQAIEWKEGRLLAVWTPRAEGHGQGPLGRKGGRAASSNMGHS